MKSMSKMVLLGRMCARERLSYLHISLDWNEPKKPLNIPAEKKHVLFSLFIWTGKRKQREWKQKKEQEKDQLENSFTYCWTIHTYQAIEWRITDTHLFINIFLWIVRQCRKKIIIISLLSAEHSLLFFLFGWNTFLTLGFNLWWLLPSYFHFSSQ